jgi:hypothetical protein
MINLNEQRSSGSPDNIQPAYHTLGNGQVRHCSCRGTDLPNQAFRRNWIGVRPVGTQRRGWHRLETKDSGEVKDHINLPFQFVIQRYGSQVEY